MSSRRPRTGGGRTNRDVVFGGSSSPDDHVPLSMNDSSAGKVCRRISWGGVQGREERVVIWKQSRLFL